MQRRILRSSLWVGLLACSPLLAEMDANQKKWAGEAETYLKQGESGLQMAKDGLGTAKPTPSRAKLALTRMGAVKTSIANAKLRIEKLPADDAMAVELKKRSEALENAVANFEDSLTNPPAEQPATPQNPPTGQPQNPQPQNPPPAAGQEGVRLDYKQEELLKNARFHSRELDGRAKGLAELADTISKAQDTNTISIRQLQAGVNTIEEVHRKEKFAEENLAQLPANGKGVADAAKVLEAIKQSVQASEKVIVPAYEKLQAALDPKNHPALGDDLKRLSELAVMYGNPDVLLTDRPQAASASAQISQAAKEHDRIVKDYALLMQQETDLGKRLTGASNHFKSRLTDFITAAKKQQESLPGEIDQDLVKVNKMAEEAVAEKKPLFFTGGIPQMIDQASDKLVLLQVLDADAAKVAAGKIEKARAELKTKEAALSEGIINSNSLPGDAYTHGDRKKIEEMAIAAWKKEQPDAEILKVRIPSDNWKRETMWRYQNSWYFIDRSKLQAQLIVKHNDKLAVIRPINMWIDHTSNDDRTAFPMDGIADVLIPQRFLLLEKAK